MDDLFGLIVIIIGIAAGIYSDKKKKEGVQKKAAVPNQPGGGRKNVPQTQVSYGGHAGRPDIIADAEKIDNAASIMHMMNANTFTCGAYHLKNADDVKSVAADLKENVMGRQWMCGFPDKLVVISVDDYLVSVFGNEELVNTFKDKLTQTYENTKVISEDGIV